MKTLGAKVGFELWKRSWNLASLAWLGLFGAILVEGFVSIVAVSIPWFGSFLSGIFACLFSYGTFCIGKSLAESSKFEFKKLIIAFNKETFTKLLPILLVRGALSFSSGLSKHFYDSNMLPFWLYFGIVLLLFVAFLALVFVPMLMMEENVTFVEATRLSYRAYMTNWLSLTIYSLTPLGIILGLALPMGISHLVIGEAGTVTGLLDVVASLPLLIGLIAMWPAMTLFTFVFYDAIFGAKTTPSLEIASNSNAEPAIL